MTFGNKPLYNAKNLQQFKKCNIYMDDESKNIPEKPNQCTNNRAITLAKK